MKWSILLFFLPVAALAAAGEDFAAKEESDTLDSFLGATRQAQPGESDAHYRVRRARSFTERDAAMKKASVAWIGGAVVHSGYLKVKPGMKVGDAIVCAGGFAHSSFHRRIIITRLGKDGEKISVTLSFDSDFPSQSEVASSPVLEPGDSVYAPEKVL